MVRCASRTWFERGGLGSNLVDLANEVGAVERGGQGGRGELRGLGFNLARRGRILRTPRTPYDPVLQSRSPVSPYIEPSMNDQKKSQI